MLEINYLLMFGTALLFTLISFYVYFAVKELQYKKYSMYILLITVSTLVSTVLWFLLAATAIYIEEPYQIYNNSSAAIETGLHGYGGQAAVSMMYFYILMGAIMIFYGLGTIPFMVIDYFKKRYMKKMEEN